MSTKHVFPKNAKMIFRLTLSAKAFSLAIAAKSKWAGFCANLREDGKWDVCITIATAHLLQQICEPHENLSDTVVRILSPAAKPAITGGQDGT